ncbi:MAG: hypothetical protein K8E24_005220 [Methanobacterium paludis]|nr:hypothetical protein [Methanobacterium paludis]
MSEPCTDEKILQQFNSIEARVQEDAPYCEVERGIGVHELIIHEPLSKYGPGAYHEYKGLAESLKKHFRCINIEEKHGLILVTI